ncbi:MAG: hypothetical protein ACK4QL_06870 [Pseudanabaenaceae cyanobacterium]
MLIHLPIQAEFLGPEGSLLAAIAQIIQLLKNGIAPSRVTKGQEGFVFARPLQSPPCF